MINKSAAIVIKNRSVLYLRKRGFLFYILPGGKIEKGETEREALQRETMEELRSRIKIVNKIGVIQSKGFNKSLDKLETIKLSLYRAQLLDKIRLSREIFDWYCGHLAACSPVGASRTAVGWARAWPSRAPGW